MLNNCILTGHLGGDPENYFTAEGTQITTFSLAFRSSKDKTGWIKVVSFNKLAEIVEKYLHKGAKVAVMATLDQQKWETENGSKKSNFQLIANNIEFIKTDGRGFDNGNQPSEEGDIPF